MKNLLAKVIIVLVFVAGALGAARAQVPGHQILGTIKPGSMANTVDIYFRPDFSNSTEYFTNLNITIAIPTSVTPPNPTLTVTSSPIPTFPVANWAAGAQPVETVGSYKLFAFNVVRTGTTAFPFTAGTEFKAATIAFTGDFPKLAQVRLADYSSLGGGASGFAYFYVETNVSSQISNSSSTSMFYSSSGNSTTGTQGSDGYAQTTTAIALPVTLSSFTGTASGCTANLAWTTATEINSSYFGVEYSTDGNSFTQVGKVISKNSPTGAGYSFAYDKLGAGTGYFRLNAVDFDGKSAYSPVVAVTGNGACAANFQIRVSPNPTTSTVNIHNLTVGSHISLLDISGKKLVEATATGTTQSLFIGNYASGMYLVRVQAADGSASDVKVIKQ